MSPLPFIDVAASIVQDERGRVLVAERMARQLSPGFWELPGGKIDRGETPAAAAARELAEETGLRAARLRPWGFYEHRFPTRGIRLHLFRVDQWEGEARGAEGQRVAWIDPAAPAVGPLLPSNERVFAALSLPRLIVSAGENDLPAAQAAAARGARLLLITARALPPAQRVVLARRAAATGARVLLEGTALEARQAGAAGVLASARALRGTVARPAGGLWGARCRTASDVARAVALGADFVIAAPVLASLDATPLLGWAGLAALAGEAGVPVYAQGGVGPEDAGRARAAGASGLVVPAGEVAKTT